MKSVALRWAAACAALLLAACSGEDDLEGLRAELAALDVMTSEPVQPSRRPGLESSYRYGAAALRSPFEPAGLGNSLPVSQAELRPDERRTKETLEGFPLDSLSMVGSLGRDGRTWALLSDARGEVHRVGVGSRLGLDHGRIVALSHSRIDVVELVPDGEGGWLERRVSIALPPPACEPADCD